MLAGNAPRPPMITETLVLFLKKIGDVYAQQIPIMIGLGCLFAALTVFKSQASNPNKVWWRNPGLATDITYALVHSLAGPYFKLPALAVALVVLTGTVMTP